MLIEAVAAWTGNTKIFVSEDRNAWTEIASDNFYSIDQPGNLNEPQDIASLGGKLYGLAEQPFRYVRVGSDDAFWEGTINLDAVKLDGQPIFGTSAIAIDEGFGSGFVTNPENVLAEDGLTATIRLEADGGGFLGVEVDFGSIQQPVNPWPDESISAVTHGIYALGGTNSNPAQNPPGYVYRPKARQLAAFVFGIYNDLIGAQSIDVGATLMDIRRFNPTHIAIHKINFNYNTTLNYVYDPSFKTSFDAMIAAEVDAYPSHDGFTLDEEQFQYNFWGYSTDPAPQWMLDWSTEIESETGIDITQAGWNSQANLITMRGYLASKAIIQHDSLHDLIKAKRPEAVVHNFIVGNTWRWALPREMKQDDWHLYIALDRWYFARTLNYKGTDYPVAYRSQEVGQGAWQCRQAGLGNDNTLCRIMADRIVSSGNHPTDVLRDVQTMLDAGVGSPYYFFWQSYCPDNPASIPTFNDFTDDWTEQNAADWTHSWQQRIEIEKLQRINAKPGDTLRANNGDWINADSYTYKWFKASDPDGLNATEIAGETTDGYLVRQEDIDSWIAAEVTAINATGSTSETTLYAYVRPTFRPAWAGQATKIIQPLAGYV